MEITLNIKAEGLEKAINNLSNALNGGLHTSQNIEGLSQQEQAPVQQDQAQQAPPQAVPTANSQPQQAVPTSTTSYSQDQLAVAATQLMDAGKQDALFGLLAEFQVQALTQLPQEQYGAFATKLRELGAKL